MTRKIAAAEFKTHCLQLMNEVKDKHTSLIITKRGIPIAKLIPIAEEPIDLFGVMKGTITFKGDIVSSIDEKWDAEQ